MKGNNWSLLAVMLVAMCHFALAAPSERVKRQDELTLDPIDTEDTQLDDADRNKRGNPEVAFQSKNAVLGFLFGGSAAASAGLAAKASSGSVFPSSSSSSSNSGSSGSTGSGYSGQASGLNYRGSARGTRPPISTTTDDTPDFDRSKVSLVVPDELFGSSFTTVTNVSKIIGDLIMGTARRTSQFFLLFKPYFGNALKIEIPPPTTTTTESPSSSNDI